MIIRTLAYGLFTASIVGTVYAAIQGVLPIWAVTIYVAFVVQLTFMTFMYAIRHTGMEDIRRAIFDLRRRHVAAWRFERELLAEFTRYAFCTSMGVNPGQWRPETGSRRRLRRDRSPWPQVNVSTVVCQYVRDDLTAKLDRQGDPDGATQPNEADKTLLIDLVAYSAETLINLSRDICAEIDEVQQEKSRFDGFIKVRVMIRDNRDDHDWLVPLAMERQHDITYTQDLRTRFRNVQRSALREFQETLKDITAPHQVDFRVRGYLIEPLVKGIMIDQRRGLFGLYTVDDLKDPEGWDYSGHGVTLLPCDIGGDYVATLAADMFNRWFSQLWASDRMTRPIDT